MERAVPYGDEVSAGASLASAGRTSFVLEVVLGAADGPRCTVRTTYVCVGEDGRPTPLPDDLRAAWGQQPSEPGSA